MNYFGVKKPKYEKKESDWNPTWHIKPTGIIKYCQHGVAEDMHCCNCHKGIKFKGMICICVGGD